MKHPIPSSGYITLEILLATIILLILAGLSYTPSSAYLKQYHRMQVRIAAQRFAADIRNLQQKALFSNNAGDKLIVLGDNKGYYWQYIQNDNRIYTYFQKIGCDGVYFKEKYSMVQFSSTGAPSGNTDYVFELKHYEDDSFSCKLTLQVVSGRLDINEIS